MSSLIGERQPAGRAYGSARSARRRFRKLLVVALLASTTPLSLGCKAGPPQTPGESIDAEIQALEAYLEKHPDDRQAWHQLSQLHWAFKGDAGAASEILLRLAQQDDPLAHLELAWMARARFDHERAQKHAMALLTLAADSGPASLANRLAETGARLLDDVLGQRASDGPKLVAFVDGIELSNLPPEASDTLLSMRARQARVEQQDAEAYYAAQGCLRQWRVGPVQGHQGALELTRLEADQALPDGDDPAVPLTCAVRLWNGSPHPGVRRLRTVVETDTSALLLSVAGEEHFRVYVDGVETYRSDEFTRWPVRRARIAVPVKPGRHNLEVHTVVTDERAWQIVRARDAKGRPLRGLAPESAQAGASAGVTGPVRAYGRLWEPVDPTVTPTNLAWVDPNVPALMRSAVFEPLRALLALDDALADADTDRGEFHANTLRERAQRWPEGKLLVADFENIEPTRGRTNSSAREQKALEAALAGDPSLDRARMRLLSKALERGEISEVVQELEALAKQEGGALQGVEGLLLRFETYRARGNELLADEALADAARLEPDNCAVLASQRVVAVERRWEKEVDRLVQELAGCPGQGALEALLAQQRGELDQAAQRYEKRLVDAEDDLSALDALAEIHVAQGQLEEAIRRLEAVVQRAPWRGTTRVRLADLLAQVGRIEKARAQIDIALTQSPHVTRLWEVAEHLGVRDELLAWREDGVDAIGRYREADRSIYEGAADVLVLDRDVVMVYPNGSQRHLIHQITELRTKASIDEHGEIPSPEGARVLTLRTIKPDGRVVEPELIPGKDGLSLRELEVGDMYEVEYIVGTGPEVSWPNYVDLSRFRFQSLAQPFHYSELIVVHPDDMPVKVEARNYPPKAEKTKKDGKTILRFLAKEMPRMPAEPHMRSGLEELPMVRVFTQPDVGDWLGNLELQIRDAQRANPALRAQAKTLTGGLSTDADKLDALRAWVLKEVEESAPIAHPATATLADREGSALMLLRVMLREAGVASELWLVRDRYAARDMADGHPLLEAYDTPMLAVHLDGASEPVMVMMSAKTIPLGYLTPGYANAPAYRLQLLDSEAPAGPVKTPRVPAGLEDARSYDLKLNLDASGDGRLVGTIELRGLEAILWRNELERLDRARLEEAFEGAELQRMFPYTALDLELLEVEGEKRLDAALRFRFEASGRGLAIAQGGSFVLPASPLALNLAGSFASLPDRWSGLVVPYAPTHQVHLDITLSGLKALGEAAKALEGSIKSDFGEYRREVDIDQGGAHLVVHIHSELATGVIEADAYPQLADFAKRVSANEELVIKLR